ncbi:MAG: hypothetical protein E6Q86_00185 [Tolumonas sp.]|nr:MAG: hypothetical protein E6Q86_00185 [Tolumonas sp.]
MDSFLTEIKNAHLFAEYLMCSGVKLPHSRSDNWEATDSHKDKVVARIKNDGQGNVRFFICAAMLGRK